MSKALIWLTGLPSSGKTAIANLLKKRIRHCEFFDGHEFPQEYPDPDGSHLQKIRAAAQSALRANRTVVCAFISPAKSTRESLRSKIEHFIEVHVDTPLEICRQRDTRGFWSSGYSVEYEPPDSPEIRISGGTETRAANMIITFLRERGYV